MGDFIEFEVAGESPGVNRSSDLGHAIGSIGNGSSLMTSV